MRSFASLALLTVCLVATAGRAQDKEVQAPTKSVKELAAALRHQDPRVRLQAAAALLSVGIYSGVKIEAWFRAGSHDASSV